MPTPSLDSFSFFLFVIPGFMTVWSFRYFTGSEKSGEFEYLAMSAFWGLVMLAFNEVLVKQEAINKLIANPYAGALALSPLGFMAGWVGSRVVLLVVLEVKRVLRS